MSISEVDICNMGLLEVGAKPKIASLTEDSDNARLCNQFYAPVRDAVLRGHLWNCAIHRATVTALADAPDSDYDHQYQLPTNPYCLRLLQVGDSDHQPTIWRVEGRKFLTDEDSPPIVYIKRITDTNEFDALLVDAISIRLAIKFATSVTNSRKMTTDLIEQYERITLPLARTIDAQETSGDAFITEDWQTARW